MPYFAFDAKSYSLMYTADVSNQMLELYEQNRVPASQVSEVESSVGGGSAHHVGSRPSARLTHEHSNSDNLGGSTKATQNRSNDNGSGEAGSVITEQKGERDTETKDSMHTESHPAHKSRSGVEAPGEEKIEKAGAHFPGDDKSRIVGTADVTAKLEAKKVQGEKTRKKDLVDEDDLIERELEDVELAVEDDKDIQNKSSMGTEHGEILDGNNLVVNTEEGEMIDDVSSTMPSRKRKMESPCEKQLGEGKRRHDNSENVEEGQKTNPGGSSHSYGDREPRRHSQER